MVTLSGIFPPSRGLNDPIALGQDWIVQTAGCLALSRSARVLSREVPPRDKGSPLDCSASSLGTAGGAVSVDLSDSRPLQPLLHDLTAIVHAPVTALSDHSGQILATGVQGGFYADCRVLSAAVLRVDGRAPQPVMQALDGEHAARVVALARHLGNRGP